MSNLPTRTMASNAQYSAVDHGGLELAEHQQAAGLEVVPKDTQAPEVVPGSQPPLEKRSSLNQPEVVHTGYYEKQDTYTDGAAPAYVDNGTAYHGYTGKEGALATPMAIEAAETKPTQPASPSRRILGMSKKTFIIALLVAVVVILAAVLGGALGATLGHDDNNNNNSSSTSTTTTTSPDTDGGASLNTSSTDVAPLQALPTTGLAAMIDGDGSGRLVTYYQDADGRIIENSYLNGQWTLGDQSHINSSVVVDSEQAQLGTPMAAVSYNLTGKTYRQIFFLSSQGYVQSVNTSATGDNGIATDWTAPVTIAHDKAASTSLAMAACADNTPGGMTGIRMYYGSQNNTIQEVGYNFSQPRQAWTEWEQFADSDYTSGVACTLWNTGDDRWISVYFRNTSTGTVEQQVWNYRYQNGWTNGPYTDVTIASGSDVAACTDGDQTDYVFFQIPGGAVTRAIVQPAGTSDFQGYDNQESATVGTRLAAAYVDGGSLYMFQNSSSSTTMFAHDISRNGAVISDLAIP